MPTGYQPMDESSCIGYRRLIKYVEKPKPLTATDLVQNSWNKLRNSRADLAEYSRLEDQHGLQVANLAHEMSNLISETDILLSRGQNLSTVSIVWSNSLLKKKKNRSNNFANHVMCMKY